MKTFRQELGKLGEDIACNFLRKKRLKILARNIKTGRFGELDIIARDKREIVFIEVKAKSNDHLGEPEEEFNFFKKKKFFRAVQNYLWKNPSDNWRVDLIAINFQSPGKYDLRHYQNISLSADII